MTVLHIITAPNPILRTPAMPVEQVDEKVRKLMDDMVKTMYFHDGVGLAANQVGVLRRVLVMNIPEITPDGRRNYERCQLYIMANPVIVRRSQEVATCEEYCFSVPEQGVKITRPAQVTVRYLDENGNTQDVECDNLLARCVQHEMDHLDGKLTLDYLSALRKDLMLKKLEKMKKIKALEMQSSRQKVL